MISSDTLIKQMIPPHRPLNRFSLQRKGKAERWLRVVNMNYSPSVIHHVFRNYQSRILTKIFEYFDDKTDMLCVLEVNQLLEGALVVIQAQLNLAEIPGHRSNSEVLQVFCNP